MKHWNSSRLWPLVLLISACQAPRYDYAAYIEHPPHSILVLPPLDETLEVNASYGSLSMLTRPLAERGFYVFPVALVDAILRSNGLPTPGEMHQVPLDKLLEIFEPDAVLYVTVRDWGASYQVISSKTEVTLSAVLVDARTGTELWRGEHSELQSSGDSGGGLIGMLATALVSQVANSISDPSREVCAQTAGVLFNSPGVGLLPGPYHPDYERSLAAAEARVTKSLAESGD